MVNVTNGLLPEVVLWHTRTVRGPYCCQDARLAGELDAVLVTSDATAANTTTDATTKILMSCKSNRARSHSKGALHDSPDADCARAGREGARLLGGRTNA